MDEIIGKIAKNTETIDQNFNRKLEERDGE